MMGDTLTFQVSPSHLFDQPPKRYKQQVLMSNTQAVSSLQRIIRNGQQFVQLGHGCQVMICTKTL